MKKDTLKLFFVKFLAYVAAMLVIIGFIALFVFITSYSYEQMVRRELSLYDLMVIASLNGGVISAILFHTQKYATSFERLFNKLLVKLSTKSKVAGDQIDVDEN